MRDLSNVLAFVEILEGTAEKVLKQISSIENEHVASTLFLPTARSCRATRNRELTEIGAAYAAQAVALKSLEEKMAQQRHKLDQMSAKHYNATCPIGSVPMEIMHQILLFAADGTPTKLIPVAPLVCQFWNKALAGLSVVWNDCRSRANDSDCLTVPLRRAGPKANVTLLQNNIPRWLTDPSLRAKISTLTLSTLSPLSDLEIFGTAALPNLVTLTLKRTQTSSPPTYGGDIILPTHSAPRLRRVVIDSIPFNFIKISHPCSCCSHSTIETIEIHNTQLFLPYLYKSLHSFKKLRQLRLIKIEEGDPAYEWHDDALDDDLPTSIEVAMLHQCDWDTTHLFFEANSFAKLRELRLAFPTFDSDPLFDLAHRDTHLSHVPTGELSPAAFCCIGLSEAVRNVSYFARHGLFLTSYPCLVVRDATVKGVLHH